LEKSLYNGRLANELGRLIGQAVAEKFHIKLCPGSNKGIYESRSVVIKSAHLGNIRFGITNKMMGEVDDVIFAREVAAGFFRIYLVELQKIIHTGIPTASLGRSKGRVTTFNGTEAISKGSMIGILKVASEIY
jgi:hypothetical protein